MRVKEELIKSGYFWLNSAPERTIPGILTISDGGNIDLEIVGLFGDAFEERNNLFSSESTIGRIVGHIEEHGLVTLEDCFYKNKNIYFGGISKSTVHVNMALLGVAYNKNEPIAFNTFQFSIEGIDDWIGLSGIKVDNKHEERTAIITYSPLDETTIFLDNGMKLLIIFKCSLPGFPHSTEAKITQKAYFKLVSEEERPISDFMTTAHMITTLLCFAIDDTVCLEKVTATVRTITQETTKGKSHPIPIAIYYASLPFTEREPLIQWPRMLFRYGQIGDYAEKIFNSWVNAYEIIDPALNLYFAVRSGTHKYLEGKFLALAQALETYHRRTSSEKLMDDVYFQELCSCLIKNCPTEHKEWLSGRINRGNELSLSRRIKSIIEPYKDLFGSSKDRSKLIRNIVDTRNYLTHYDESMSELSSSGKELLYLCLKLEAIFQLHLLQVLGFTKNEILSIFNSNYKLKQKVNLT